jgi:uncharacterized SAM-binding protein YcdF (DUF218 family)
MFDAVAKTVWFFAQPSGFLLLLLLCGAILLATRYRKAGVVLLLAGTAFLVIAGVSPLSTWVTLPLEDRFARADLSKGPAVDGIIVLGGAEDARVYAARHTHEMNESAERITEGAALALRFPKAKLLFTSNSITADGVRTTGAETAAAVFRDLGIAPDRLIAETDSKNTYENAVFSKRLLQPKPGERWGLVTTASHMPRSIGVFRKAGFPVEPWPVDYRTAGPGDAWLLFRTPAEGLRRLEYAMHEWLGLLAYRLTGRSDELFPAP